MRQTLISTVVLLLVLLVGDLRGADVPPAAWRDGWSLLREGEAQGEIAAPATHPAVTDPQAALLRITATRVPGPGQGRIGAVNSQPVEVRADGWYDITFSAATQSGSVGLVFSLESPDGTVLARTTLPEIGRGGRGARGARAGATGPWPQYLVGLHARGAGTARLVITPIEPTTIWLQNLQLVERP
jgi:hypothetical protein